MIKSFANQETEQLYHGIHTHHLRKLLPSHLVKVAERRLDILNCIESLDHLKSCFPGDSWEAAVRDAHNKYSIPIEGNWRIAFRWDNSDAHDVEIKT